VSVNVYNLEEWRQLENLRRVARTRTKELAMLPVGASFIVHIDTWSLSGAAIVSGDRLSCERADTLMRGQLGIVRTPYGILPRFVYFEPEYARLETADHTSPTLCLPLHEVEVIGRPVKLVRRFPDALRESEVAL
jgi:SOS-response transcriptional repressor LexA